VDPGRSPLKLDRRVAGVIDIEQHVVTPALLEACIAAPAGSTGAALAASYARTGAATLDERVAEELVDLSARVVEMDGCGISVAVLSTPLMPSYALDHKAATVELVPKMNEQLVAAAEAHRGRFALFASLPFPYPEECLRELERLEGHPLVKGVVAHTPVDAWTLDDPALEPVYTWLSDRELPVLLHPAASHFGQVPAFADWRLDKAIGMMTETSVAGARLVFSGMLDRVPSLQVIIPHLGGLLPYLEQRIEDLCGKGSAENDLSYYLENRFLFDSCSLHRPALTCAAETVGPDRIMLASDYPYRGPLARTVRDIVDSGFSDSDRQLMLSGIAVKLGLDLT
jgi:predicted TIM-barrel fold metal-dependent hydrolase